MEINQVKFNAIVESAKAKAADHPEWLRAIAKAADAILSGKMIVTTLARGALVTTDGGTYHANGECDCAAQTRHCYHRAGARLMALYEAEPDTPETKSGPRKPEITRSVERDIITRRRIRVTRCNNWVI